MKTLLKIFVLVIIFWSCNVSTRQKVKNSAVIDVLNGMGKKDTVRYTCDSCDKYITSNSVLNKVIEQATKEAKASLNNPLSFIPRSIKMTVEPRDSFYYYSTNKRIDSCLLISVEYNCIGKNAYGTEGEVNSTSLIFLVGNQIKEDFLDDIRKKPLTTENGGKTVSRELTLFDIEGEGNFTILPTLSKPYSLIVKSSISCIDKDATLSITFEDQSELRLKNWNDFNCNGTAYFSLTAESIEKLKSLKPEIISFHSDKLQYAQIRPNDSDYFKQYVSLLPK